MPPAPSDLNLDVREKNILLQIIRSRGLKGCTVTVAFARLALESNKSQDAVRRFLVSNAAFVLGGRPLRAVNKEFVRRRREGEDVFVATEHAWPARACASCAGPNEAWYLTGGGFDDNVHAALVREALPFAVCELCFRRWFCAQPDPVAVGLAVLPMVSTTMLDLQCLKAVARLGEASAARVAEALNLDVAVVELVLDALADDDRLSRQLDGDAATGRLAVVYGCDAKPDAGLVLSLARQTSPQGLFGFSELTAVRVRVPPGGFDVVRTAQDFCWLRDELGLLGGQSLPALPAFQHVGRFNASFLQSRVQALAVFLAHVTTRLPFRRQPATAAFFRPGFDFAKAGVEASGRPLSHSEGVLASRASASIRVVCRGLADTARESARAMEALGFALREAGMFAECDEWTTVAKAMLTNVATTDGDPLPADDVRAIVQHGIAKAAADARKWRLVKDLLLA